ncbi:MAG TPA: hypothetical protein DEQ47_03865 [Solibacterales bacterium]|nr:hypothetical protein [Bryobacterales bacterium]
MTITLILPPETEQTLLAQAKAKGVALDVFLQTIIANQAAAAESMKPQTIPRDGEDWDRSIDELFDTVQVPPGVGEGAMRRENWYR